MAIGESSQVTDQAVVGEAVTDLRLQRDYISNPSNFHHPAEMTPNKHGNSTKKTAKLLLRFV